MICAVPLRRAIVAADIGLFPCPPEPQDWLASYGAGASKGDLYRGASPQVSAQWAAMATGLARLSGGEGASIQDQVARQIGDLGLTFRVAGDADERIWPLTPMPLIVGAEEWATVEAGLIQRVTLLERLAADIYGPQNLVKDGHLPAALIAGSPWFARRMIGLPAKAGHFLHVYAADLARGPGGQWRVLGDRLRLANGIGYALENRLAISRSTGTLLGDINARRLASFFADLRAGFAADCQRERPRIALLTPGRHNQSYPEQAHLARYLGLPLVEGRDLVVSDDKLYVRTIAGPKRIDAVWRWIDTNALDPLSFDSRSQLGVPDLACAWSRGGLEMVNWPGVEVLESRALSAFLPRLFGQILGQDPILPNIATWWCGQAKEADIVRQRLDDLVIAPAFGFAAEGLPGPGSCAGASLNAEQRATLLDAIHRRPMDYCGQEIVQLSTTPALIGEALVPRPFTIRAYVARDGAGNWVVMPGGFARLSSSGELLNSLMGKGDLSADVCIVDPEALSRSEVQSRHIAPPLESTPQIRRGGGILASQAADNLFWFSRYGERAEVTLRILRSLLGSSIEVDGSPAQNAGASTTLVHLLYLWGAISAETARQPLPQLCRAALAESHLPGGVAGLMRRGHDVGLSLRQRFSRDFWHIASQPMPPIHNDHPQSLLDLAKNLIDHFSALSGQIAENMMRDAAFAFLDMGRRLERALSICRITRQLGDEASEPDDLNILLDLCDSQITYRSRYLAGALRGPVLDLVLLDPDNPRSLVYQVKAMVDHIAALPSLMQNHVPEQPLRDARAILAPLQTLTIEDVTSDKLQEIETRLLALSDAIATRYFLPFETPESREQGTLLA